MVMGSREKSQGGGNHPPLVRRGLREKLVKKEKIRKKCIKEFYYNYDKSKKIKIKSKTKLKEKGRNVLISISTEQS